MKSTILYMFFATFCVATATELPKNIKKAKEERAKKIAQLDLAYVKELEKAKRDATRKGNLDLALKLKEEIGLFSPKSIIGKWQWREDEVIEFKSSGTAKTNKSQGWKWEKTGNDTFSITTPWGKKVLAIIGEDLDKALRKSSTVTNGTHMTRIK